MTCQLLNETSQSTTLKLGWCRLVIIGYFALMVELQILWCFFNCLLGDHWNFTKEVFEFLVAICRSDFGICILLSLATTIMHDAPIVSSPQSHCALMRSATATIMVHVFVLHTLLQAPAQQEQVHFQPQAQPVA